MGIYDQPNSWQCGPFALKHGLFAHGIFVHEDTLTEAAGSTPELGTDERQLSRAARELGCVLLMERHHVAPLARRALHRLLAAQVPVLLCVDQWDHWVTAVGADASQVVVLDSHYETVVRLEPWRALLRRLAFRRRPWRWGPPLRWYDLHPLFSRGETGLRLALTPERARRLLDAPSTFRRSLDAHARRLAPFVARGGRRSGVFALAPWLREQAADAMECPPPADTLDEAAFTAELFGARSRAPAARDFVRALVTPSTTAPRPAKAYPPSGVLAAAS